MSDLLPVPTIAETAKKYGFPIAMRDMPGTRIPPPAVNPFEAGTAVGPILPATNNLAAVRGTPNTRIEPTPFENLLKMLVGPQEEKPLGLIGVRG